MGKSKTDTGYDDLRKRRKINSKGVATSSSAPPSAAPPPPICPGGRIFAKKMCDNWVLSPGYTGAWNWLSGSLPLASSALIDGVFPVVGDRFEVAPTIMRTNCDTGIQTMVNVPLAQQGDYTIYNVTAWNPLWGTLTDYTDFPSTPTPPCPYIGNPIKVCLCSVGPGGTGTVGQTFDSMLGTSFGSPSTFFFRTITIDGATPIVGQEFEVTLAGGVDWFSTAYNHWSWLGVNNIQGTNNPANTQVMNMPTSLYNNMSDIIGVLKVLTVHPQVPYWNPPAPLQTGIGLAGIHVNVMFNSLPSGTCASGACPVCNPVAWNAIPYAYFTEWTHIPSMFYNPPIVLNPWWAGPGGYTSPSSGGTNFPVGGPIWNYDANIDYPNQSSICEWCDDWNANGAVPGTFDNRVIAWGYTLTQAEAFCTCCPNWFISPPGPLEIPPTGFTN